MSTATKLYRQALALDESERARLALHLLESVSPPDPTDEATWLAEIERRAALAIAGESDATPLDDALDRIGRDLGL